MSGPVVIRLTFGEMSMAAAIASLRYTSNIIKQRPHQHGQTGYRWPVDSLCAEIALARHLNRYWNGDVNNTKERDVGGMIDVRSCEPGKRLILHPDDPDDVPFVLAWISVLPDVELVGWLLGRDGKQPEFWDDPGTGRPAYFIPKGRLHDMAMLHDWADDRVRSRAA
jgi:hypothetical protein